LFEKEQVSKAKLAETFSQRIWDNCLKFIKEWEEVFAKNPFEPLPLDNGVDMRVLLDQNAVPMKDTPIKMFPEQHKIIKEHNLYGPMLSLQPFLIRTISSHSFLVLNASISTRVLKAVRLVCPPCW
jgi:hypothetical protein